MKVTKMVRSVWNRFREYPRAKRIHLILDNYGIHKSQFTKMILASCQGKVRLHFSPPYCPDEDRIERVWLDLHANVTRNHQCRTIDELMTEVRHWLRKENKRLQKRYLVRWLEWLACVGFWWNPLVWWGRQHLRANEEICCDDLVLSSLNPKPRTYAESLLNAIEHLASPVLRPPAMASEINSGGFLRRRFKMIVSGKTDRSRSRWPQVCVLLGAMLVLPLGLAYGEDLDAKTNAYLKQVWSELQAEVEAGNMSTEDAEARMTALKKAKLGDEKKLKGN